MRKREKQLPWWQIILIKGTPAALVGRVRAPEQETAINLAAEQYGITNPVKRARLAAYRVS